MQVSDFSYELPDELIARYPAPKRTASRLLILDSHHAIHHGQFTDLLTLLHPGDLLVFNNTRVIPARLWGRKLSGGKVEVLIERILSADRALAHISTNKPLKVGVCLLLENCVEVEVVARHRDLFELVFYGQQTVLDFVESRGHTPLPPYLRRPAEAIDRERYQTVFSRYQGAVAAPTAGLHFDQDFLEKLTQKGIGSAFVTLHVGAGTFQPVKVATITDHVMHGERVIVPQETCDKIITTKAQGKRVVAVGTTVVRSLETAAQSGTIQSYDGETSLFIYPGYQFRSVDAVLTNFHAPQSTLLMLISAFCGYETVMQAYQQAIALRYRFLSYGDAMFIMKESHAI